MEANTLLSELATALVVALVPVVIGALAWVARSAVAYIKARTSAEHYQLLEKLAGQAVASVEQTLKTANSRAKLEAAKAVVTSALLKKGIKIDEEQVVAAIEAAVYVEKGITISIPEDVSVPVLPAEEKLPELADERAEGPILA